MGSSFCDPTREVCPFGAAIDPTQALVNNIFQGVGTQFPAVPGIAGPISPPLQEPTVGTRNAPSTFTLGIPPISFPGGFTLPPINVGFGGGGGFVPQGPTRTPPLLPGRIPPAPLAFPTPGGGCNGGPAGGPVVNGCCPRGQHPDKKFGVKCVRNRRMNVANMRAAKRATRRLAGFDKMARAAKKELKKLCR